MGGLFKDVVCLQEPGGGCAGAGEADLASVYLLALTSSVRGVCSFHFHADTVGRTSLTGRMGRDGRIP